MAVSLFLIELTLPKILPMFFINMLFLYIMKYIWTFFDLEFVFSYLLITLLFVKGKYFKYTSCIQIGRKIKVPKVEFLTDI